MKAVAFDYARPATIMAASRLLAEHPGAKVLAGGQTLGPMLNLRLVQPTLLIDITRITDLARVDETGDAVILGSCITHAAIEDGHVPDPAAGILARVAHGIASRAVRTRGTIGGSIVHADPVADWLSCLIALSADVLISGVDGRREIPLQRFVSGAMTTSLQANEIVEAIRIPKLRRGARVGYAKICRKTGEFAEAIGVAVHDPERYELRLIAGTSESAPIVIDDVACMRTDHSSAADQLLDREQLRRCLMAAGHGADIYKLNVCVSALERAAAEAWR
jgi:aerobic carbon-monoxide dehydrogenase medium subunit